MKGASPVLGSFFSVTEKLRKTLFLSKFCEKYHIPKAICDFSQKSNELKVRMFIVLLLFSKASDNGVKGILL